jgi:aryl-alcohol dehydrogenase-like predicted oxidoreductase
LGTLIHSEKTPRETAILDAVLAVAAETGTTPTQVAIAWIRSKAATSPTALIPILGPRTRAQLDDNLAALSVTLSDSQVRRLDQASVVPLGFPHELLASDRNAKRIAGGKPDLIDIPRVPAA